MSKASSLIAALERRMRQRRPALPFKSLFYDDGLYHEGFPERGGRTYTEDEVEKLQTEYQLIAMCYSDTWRPGDGPVIQMTWGDDDPDETIPDEV